MSNKINIVIGADIENLKKGFQDAIKITGASGNRISSAMEATAKQIEADFDRIARSSNTKRAVAQLQNLALKVQALGPEFQDMANKIIQSAGSIKDSVGDIGAQIDYFASDTRRIDAVVSAAQGVAGAFAIAEGAAVLLGSENEDLQKTMQKVQASIAVLNGIQAVQNVLQQESAAFTGLNALAQRALALQAYATATAMNALKVALVSTGIGAAVVLVGSLAVAFGDAADEADRLAENTKKSQQQAEEGAKAALDFQKSFIAKRMAEMSKEGKLQGKSEQQILKQQISFLKEQAKQRLDERKNLSDSNKTKGELLKEYLNIQDQIYGLELDLQLQANDDKKKATDDAIKLQQKQLKSSSDLAESNIKTKRDELLSTAKSEEEKVRINYNAELESLKNKEDYLIKSEGLAKKEDRNAQVLKDNLSIIANERKSLESKFSTDITAAKEKDLEEQRKIIEASQRAMEENNRWADEQNKKELEAINNYYQAKENQATKDYQAGLISEKQYNNAILRLQLERAKNTLQALKDSGASNLAEIEKQILEIEGKIQQGQNNIANANKQFNDQINSAFQSIAQSGFENLGRTIGNSITSGTSFIDGAFKVVLESIASFMEAYGKAMIGVGVAQLALDTGLKTMNPAVAIAGGVALIGAATVVRNLENGGVTAFADGGIVSGPTLGLMGEYPGASSNPEVIAPLDKLKSMIGGNSESSGYIAETRVSGRDLAIVLNRYNKEASRT